MENYKEFLLAIKWLGNAGSHPDIITTDDVMDTYEIMEHVLENIYENKEKNIRKIAKRINKRKGPKK